MWTDSYHILISLSAISFAVFLLYLAHTVRRGKEFRVKLAIFGLLSLIMGTCVFTGECFSPQYTVTLLWIFIWSMAVLYWREMRRIVTSEGWHRQALVQLSRVLPDYLWTTDIAGQVLFMNSAMKHDFFGYPEGSSVFGKTIADIKKEKSQPLKKYIFRTLYEDGDTKWEYGEIEGRVVVYNTLSTDVSLPNGKKVGAVHLSREVRIKKDLCAVIGDLMECSGMEEADKIVGERGAGDAYV